MLDMRELRQFSLEMGDGNDQIMQEIYWLAQSSALVFLTGHQTSHHGV